MSIGFDRFAWDWSESDQQAYSKLRGEVKPKRKRSVRDRGVHIFWPVTVLEVKEVRDEIDRVKSGRLLSSDDEKDRELAMVMHKILHYSPQTEERLKSMTPEELIRFLIEDRNDGMRLTVSKMYQTLMAIYKEVNSIFWFALCHF